MAMFCCALGRVESGRSRPHDARVAMRENVGAVGAVVALGAGLDLVASEIGQECGQGVETEGHCVRKRRE
jgi:hypothetical protein